MNSSLEKILITLAIIVFISSCKPGDITLRLHPANKSQYKIFFKSEGKVSVTVAGNEVSTDIQTGISSILKIDTLGAGRFRFMLNYDDFDMDQKADGKPVSLNLKTDSAGNEKEIRDFMRGVSFEGIVNENGKAENVQPSNSLKGKMDNLVSQMPENEKQQVMAVIGPLLSSDMARGMIDQCFYVFPPEKVNIGDSWKNEITMQSIFSMEMKSTFTLMEIKDSIALLKVHSNISPNKNEVMMPGLAMNSPKGSDPRPGPGGFDIMGMKLTAAFEGTQDGNVWVNMKTGMIERNLLNQDLKGKISISIIDMPMSMKMMTGYDIKPAL